MKNLKNYEYASFVWQLLGFLGAYIFFLSITKLSHTKRKCIDFITADDGAYSLSRTQALVWAYVIISFQTGVILCMLFSGGKGYGIEEFQLIFPEQILFLLGLSFSSYIIVKNISVNEIAEGRNTDLRKQGKWSDLITGANGLDLSKYQMVVWTLLAIIVYVGHCHMFFYKLCEGNKDLNKQSAKYLFLTSEEKLTINKDSTKIKELNINNRNDEEDIPSISWSFLVLMGLSQGVYIGKKLIRQDKVEDVRNKDLKESKQEELKLEKDIILKDFEMNKLNVAVQDRMVRDKVILKNEKNALVNKLNVAKQKSSNTNMPDQTVLEIDILRKDFEINTLELTHQNKLNTDKVVLENQKKGLVNNLMKVKSKITELNTVLNFNKEQKG